MHLYGGLPSVLAALAVLLLAAFLALYYALACGVWLWARVLALKRAPRCTT